MKSNFKRQISLLMLLIFMTQPLAGMTFDEMLMENNDEKEELIYKLEDISVNEGTTTVEKLTTDFAKLDSKNEKKYELDVTNDNEIISLDDTGYYTLTSSDVVILDNIITDFIGDISVIGTDIIIPSHIADEEVKTIGSFAFRADGLTSVEISEGVTHIDDSAFRENALTSVKMPKSVTHIGDYAFRDNTLTNVEIPEGVTYIGDRAFCENTLATVDIPESVTRIGIETYAVNALINVDIPESVTHIGEGAFSANALTSVDIPKSVTHIDDFAFSYNFLNKIEIPDHEITISKHAFEGAFYLTGQLTVKGTQSVSMEYLNTLHIESELYHYGGTTLLNSDTITGGTTLYWGEYQVKFIDYDGSQIDNIVSIRHGADVTAPLAPIRSGYVFTNWDKDLSDVQSDLIVTAEYAEDRNDDGIADVNYTVIFKDHDGSTLNTQTVLKGDSAIAPPSPSRSGYLFTSWDKNFTNIQSNLEVIAQYKIKPSDSSSDSSSSGLSSGPTYYLVTFKNFNGDVIKKISVKRGKDAQAPKTPIREGYVFTGWSDDFTNVKKSLIVLAQYEEVKNSKAYMIGMPDGTFQPEKYLTRAELVSLFDRFYALEDNFSVSASYNIYSDVELDAWYYDAVNRMTQRGLVRGYEDGTFRPDQEVTREELAQVVYNHFNLGDCYKREVNSDYGANCYTDIYNRWSTDALMGLQIRGLLQDFSAGSFTPKSPICRGETVLLLNRYFGYSSGYDKEFVATFSDIGSDSKWSLPVALASKDQLIYSKFINELEGETN